ncbi:hypothetical protein E2C01_076444 [Portunus trituberculatus]|uniref:Uncharacterized protein n=1 Tax=Portunus trituberculatus TaxID=210409 RepID=A0A5B7IIV6_PORTR|nr:hypothetical protein [Portunus trituberculatus]
MDRIRTRALGDPSDPKARMVPLYHGGTQDYLRFGDMTYEFCLTFWMIL